MSKKQLKTYQFGTSIMSEYQMFSYKFLDVGYAYHEGHKPQLKNLKFEWEWNDYSGWGHIHFWEGTCVVVNEDGENYSQINIFSNSKKKPNTGKMYSPLYNDSSLEELFNRMLSDAKAKNII